MEDFLWNDLKWYGKDSYLPLGRQGVQDLFEKNRSTENDIHLVKLYHSNPSKALNKKKAFDLNPLQYAQFIAAPPTVRAKLRKAGSCEGPHFSRERAARKILYTAIRSNDKKEVSKKESEFIRLLQSNNPEIGYNLTHRHKML